MFACLLACLSSEPISADNMQYQKTPNEASLAAAFGFLLPTPVGFQARKISGLYIPCFACWFFSPYIAPITRGSVSTLCYTHTHTQRLHGNRYCHYLSSYLHIPSNPETHVPTNTLISYSHSHDTSSNSEARRPDQNIVLGCRANRRKGSTSTSKRSHL